jgi:hypothetical protein
MPMMSAILLAAAVTFAGTQPQLAAIGEQVYLTFGSAKTVSVARSIDGGATFSAPVALPPAGKLSLGMRRGPRIAATPRTVLVAAIAGAKGGGADGDVVLYRSTDGGRTWAAPLVVNDVPGAAREGLHGLAANDAGLVAVAWLDLREKGTRVYVAVSRDHGATWSADTLAYASPSGSVCECCHPSVAIAPGGRIAVLFRNHRDGARDMYLVESRDGGSTFGAATKQGQGTWPLQACPMDGGGAVATDTATWTAWRRDDAVYTTSLRGSGSGGSEVKLGPGRDPVIAAHGEQVDVAWSTPEGVRIAQSGQVSGQPIAGRFPSIAALAGHTLVAVEDRATVRVERLVRRPR